MQVKLSNISVIFAMLVGASSVVACSGVDDYPVSGRGGQQNGTGNGGSSDANGGSNNGNGGATNTNGGSSNGNGGNNSGGMSFGQGGSGQGGSGQGGSGQGGAAKGGASFGSGGSSTSFGNGGSNNSGGKSGSSGGNSSTGNGGGTSTGVSFNQVQSIVNKSCGIVGCHNSGGESPNLSTTGNTLFGTLTNTTVRQCSSNKLVAANNTSASAIVGLITGKCSLRMPLGCTSSPCISQADTDTISNWITQGAKQQ